MKVLSLGAGKMAQALLVPMCQEAVRRGEVSFQVYTPSLRRAKVLAEKIGGCWLENLSHDPMLREQNYIFLCCKPQQFQDLAKEIGGRLNPKTIVVSLLAATPFQTLCHCLEHKRVIRLMPNLASQVGAGITLFLATPQVGQRQIGQLWEELKKNGKIFQAQSEDHLDRLTGYTGSGAAYLFELARILAKDLEAFEVSPQEAQDLVVEMIWGAAKVMKESSKTPEELRNDVTSQGGVTFEALEVLKRGGLDKLFRQALEANYQRSKELRS